MAFVSGEGALPSIRISPLVGGEQTVGELDEGRFAAAVRAEQTDDAARLDGKLHALEGGFAAVALGERLTF